MNIIKFTVCCFKMFNDVIFQYPQPASQLNDCIHYIFNMSVFESLPELCITTNISCNFVPMRPLAGHEHSHITSYIRGYDATQLVETLRYMLEGRWFDFRWCHWHFSLT